MLTEASYSTREGLARLRERAQELMGQLTHCRTCGHLCGVDRTCEDGSVHSACRTGVTVQVSTAYPHFGEETVLKGSNGSGTVFFTRCNMGCIYCQNEPISGKQAQGRFLTTEELGETFLDLQAKGVHNINWVSPSHVVPQALAGLAHAAERGLQLPVVYNTGGYDSFETIRALDGLVDIYLPDVKTLDERHARTLLKAPGYPDAVLLSLEEMISQVGMTWQLRPDGTLARGILVRHLVLPDAMANSLEVLEGLLDEFGPDLPLHIMGQYIPNEKARATSGNLARELTPETYLDVLRSARKMGFKHLVGVKSAA